MDKFGNIKALCSYFSRYDAIECAQKTGINIIIDNQNDLDISPKNLKKIARISRDRAFWFGSGNFGRNLRDEDGSLIRGFGFDFEFFKEAFHQFPFINHLDKSFNLRVDNNKLCIIYSHEANFTPIIKKVHYFIGGDKPWYVNIDAAIPTLKRSISPVGGICNKENHYIGVSIEFPLDAFAIIHEIVHMKWPADYPETEQRIDELTGEVLKNIIPMLSSMNDREKLRSKADQELKRISEDFESLDRQVGRILDIQ